MPLSPEEIDDQIDRLSERFDQLEVELDLHFRFNLQLDITGVEGLEWRKRGKVFRFVTRRAAGETKRLADSGLDVRLAVAHHIKSIVTQLEDHQQARSENIGLAITKVETMLASLESDDG